MGPLEEVMEVEGERGSGRRERKRNRNRHRTTEPHDKDIVIDHSVVVSLSFVDLSVDVAVTFFSGAS